MSQMQNGMMRRGVLGGGLALAVAGARRADAETFPSRAVTIIVALAAGGPTDLLARIVAQKLSAAWGQSVIVENRPGAGQLLGTGIAAKAAPDGYTLLMMTNVYAVNPFLYKKLPYDPKKDLIPVVGVASSSLTLVVNPSLPVQSVADLIAYARKNPGKLNYGSSGPGSSLRLAAELFDDAAQIQMQHIPYDGAAPLMTALLGNEVQVAFIDTPTAKAQIAAKRVRALAVTSARRSAVLPDLPTMEEAGLGGYTAESWFGLMAPAGTPAPVIDKVQASVVDLLKLPDVEARLQANDETPIGGTSAAFGAFIAQEMTKWGNLIREHHISIE